MESFGRFWRTNVKNFGVYEKVLPVETTPSRIVPQHIERPNYISTNETFVIPSVPEIKNINQIRGMRRSCKIAASILRDLHKFIQPGISTDEIDYVAHNICIEAGAYPSPLHYHDFPKSVCTSVNNVIVHGIPDLRLLKSGDIVNVDVTVFFKGFHGDCSKTYIVGDVDDKGLELVSVTEECLDIATKTCGPGVPFSEIGSVIYKHAKRYGLTVIPSVLGHGLGEYFHGPPEINHTINDYPGKMKPGMTFTIEPAITHGSEYSVLLEDNWTLVTEDGARCAQAEHTILVTEDGCEILTQR
ncbi:unnamed protein product [Chrysodeixis includens]|uniref:Methionine aminopeptidase n=1 Tax=Chrysodeixis includens TaxID=689277 RepID=A0A9P0BR59_CHRIL|nr:unnamed protein product [Chrysodeixis includens]